VKVGGEKGGQPFPYFERGKGNRTVGGYKKTVPGEVRWKVDRGGPTKEEKPNRIGILT